MPARTALKANSISIAQDLQMQLKKKERQKTHKVEAVQNLQFIQCFDSHKQ